MVSRKKWDPFCQGTPCEQIIIGGETYSLWRRPEYIHHEKEKDDEQMITDDQSKINQHKAATENQEFDHVDSSADTDRTPSNYEQ